jgi:cell division protein FtsB
MNVSVIWDQLSKITLFLIFVAALVFAFLWYRPLITKNQNYRRELLTLDTRLAEQERLGKHLRASIDSLQQDPKAVERLAREKLGWARTNETVIRFEQPARR